MIKKEPSQEHLDYVSKAIHRNTITMASAILMLGIIILPWSNTASAAFVPLVLSMAVSLFTLIKASLSLRKQIKEEIKRKAELGPFAHMLNSDVNEEDVSAGND